MMAIYKTLVKKVSLSAQKKTKQKEYLSNGVLPIIDQGHEYIGGYSNDLSKKVDCKLPVIVFGDHTKAVKYINFPFGAGADGIKVLQPEENINPLYLYYGTKYLTYRIEDKGYARHYQNLEKKDLSVPSLEEQRRIVSRIEEMFSKLDKSVEIIQNIRMKLSVYRQVILKEAFDSCNDCRRVEQVCIHVTDGDHFPPPKAKMGIPFIMISNIKNNKIVWENTNYVETDYYYQIGEKRTPVKGDVLYTVTGSYGIPILVDFDNKFCFQRHIALLRPNECITQKFLYYVMQSPDVYRQASEQATGTAQKTVALSVLRKISIPYCDLNKQQIIVSEIESHFSVCDSIEQMIDTALQQANAIRQGILKQAFEG